MIYAEIFLILIFEQYERHCILKHAQVTVEW